ncbi:MAG: DUF3472 domain-containing protein [Alistipes sp.]|nr:DUF3472 domain-containing protein [Alistipes sp.]
MKSIRKFFLVAVCALTAVATFSQCAPKVEELTLAIPFKCNAYVTPLDPASKETPAFANDIIANGYSLPNDAEMVAGAWLTEYQEQTPHQISVFFYTAYTGELHIGLRAADVPEGVAELKVKCCGKSFNLKVDSADASKDYYVGKVNVEKAGHVRVDIEPVKTSAASYPTFSTLLATGAAVNNLTEKVKDELIFVTAEELQKHVPHFVRRGPSNHFQWDTPENTEYFYNEVFVPEGEDISGAYYMLTGGDGFYMGIQPNEKGKNRMVLFSVWDTNTEKGLISELVRNGEGVKTNSYSHEGSGVQNFYNYDWEAGRTYATLVRVRPEYKNGKATGNSLYTGYFRGDEGWVFLAEIRRPGIETYYKGAYSFCENFRPECGWIPRSVEFPSQWMRDKDGNWTELKSGRLTCDGTGHEGLRCDYSGGVSERGNFYLRNIGYIDDKVEYGTRFEREGSGKAPEIDFKALIKLSGSTDDRSKF